MNINKIIVRILVVVFCFCVNTVYVFAEDTEIPTEEITEEITEETTEFITEETTEEATEFTTEETTETTTETTTEDPTAGGDVEDVGSLTETTTEATTDTTLETTTERTTTESTTQTATETTTHKTEVTTETTTQTTTQTATQTTTEITTQTTTHKTSSGGSGSGGIFSLSLNNMAKSETTTETPTETTTTAVSSRIEFSVGSEWIGVNGVKHITGLMPFIQKETQSMLIPVRMLEYAFPNQITYTWNSEKKIATIRYKDKVVKMIADSKYTLVNNVPVANANNAKTEIVNKRICIPVRTLGEVLGFKVEWDKNTNTAIYIVD